MMQTDLTTWLDYIDSVHPKKMDLSLGRIRTVAERLELLPFKPFTITVAGTNGKGTTCSLISEILVAAGFKVGTTLSPHLFKFNERINLNGEPVSDDCIITAFERIEAVRAELTLSYFEFAVLAALLIFKENAVDIAVLEVGLGGRFDGVNIVDADIAVITNIGFDHMDILGHSLEQIGEAKAGIIRGHKPVVYGGTVMPHSIAIEAEQKKAKLVKAVEQIKILKTNSGMSFESTCDTYNFQHVNIIPDNIATVITTLEQLPKEFMVTPQLVEKVVDDFSLAGRWQIIQKQCPHIFDVSHNKDGISKLLDFLTERNCAGKIYAVFSMLNRKDINTCLEMMRCKIDEWFVAPLMHSTGFNKEELMKAFANAKINQLHLSDSISDAYQSANQKAGSADQIIVFGSFHTVAEALQLKV